MSTLLLLWKIKGYHSWLTQQNVFKNLANLCHRPAQNCEAEQNASVQTRRALIREATI